MTRLWQHVNRQPLALHEGSVQTLLDILARREAGVRLPRAELDEALAMPRARLAAAHARYAEVVGMEYDDDDDDGGAVLTVTAPKAPAPYERVGSVALVPVRGVMMKYASMVEDISPGESISAERIIRGLMRAGEDSAVSRVVMVIDSPGGSVKGGDALIDAVKTVRAKKPVAAFLDDAGYSMAYLLASQADAVYAGPGAGVGSIGVYAVLYDTSKLYDEMGIKARLLRSRGAKFKGIGEDGVKIDEAELEAVQREIDACGDWLIGSIAEGRGMDAEKVRELATGEAWMGEEARKRGLIDGVTSLRALVQELNTAA